MDPDNDGWLDIFMVNGHVYPEMGDRYRQKPLIFRNLRNGKFEEWPLLLSPLPGRGAAIGDFDNDGDLDILINNIDAPPALYENKGKPAGNWITVEASTGARITVRANGTTQFSEARSSSGYLSSSDRRMHFGLGEAPAADEIQIAYGGGRSETLKNVKANQRLSRR